MMRIKVLGLAAIVAAIGSAASAAPLSLGSSSVIAGEAQIERVAGGCGPGWHPNPWGRCRPNFYGPRPYYRPYGAYGPRPYYRPYGGYYGPRQVYRPYY